MLDKNLKILEFDKILDLLSEVVSNEDAKKLVLNLRPSNDVNIVNKLLNQTDDAYKLSERFGFPKFDGMKCIKDYLKQAKIGVVLSLKAFLEIASTLSVMRSIKKWRNDFLENDDTCLDEFFNKITLNNYIEKKILSIIISENEISDTASDTLFKLRQKIRNMNSKIRDNLEDIVHSSRYQKYLQDSIITIRNDRFVIPVKAEFKNEIAGITHGLSATGSTIFVEPMSVMEDNNKINILKSQEKDEVNKILKNLSIEVGSFYDSILTSYEMLLELDVIFSRAFLGYKMNATKPVVNDKGFIKLLQARHPLISEETVVPIDIELGINFDSLIITGSNTGGKTVSLKTVGLLTAMVMSGMFVPAGEGSRMSIFDNILVDIGDEQSIEQSLSTFSSHIKNIIHLLSIVNEKSLVLLDEVGAGTDPTEGASLAIAILEECRQKGSKIISTTHYKELKKYAIKTSGVENASCEFDLETIKPTYKLLIGVPGSSNAFLIAQRLGMDINIINNAKSISKSEDNMLENIIKELNDTKTSLEKEKMEVSFKLQEINKNSDILKSKLDNIEVEKQKIIDDALNKAKKIFYKTKLYSDSVLNELKAFKNNQKTLSHENSLSIKQKMQKLENLVDPIQHTNLDKNMANYTLKKGDRVRINSINKDGFIISEVTKSKEILVQIGSFRTKVSKNDVTLINSQKAMPKSNVNLVKTYKLGISDGRLDLRGMNTFDALTELENFISMAMMSNLNELVIIHGKGTGILRAEVHNYLKNNKFIKSYRLGKFGEGENGVTIVEI